MTCCVEGCDRPIHVKSRQLCNRHYIRWRLFGDPLGGNPERGLPLQWINDHLDSVSDECLIWPYSTNDHGYGRIRVGNREWVASRLMCAMKHGDAPSDRHEAAHSCGNGHLGCTNPNHLRWATPEENQADRVEHGTSNRGEQNAQSVLSSDDVLRVMDMKRSGEAQRDIAQRFGIAEMTVSDIVNGRRWGWLTGIEPKERPGRKRRPIAANDNQPAKERAA